MIISRTPFRISFFGGGTDYPEWYLKHGGGVLAAGIDKYCYLTCRYLPPFFEHRYRIVYSRSEMCSKIEDIAHPAVRAVLQFMEIDRGLEIHHDGDLPARSGMGSSSSFTVGLMHALYGLTFRMVDKKKLMKDAIHVEQNIVNETVGSQDQVTAAYGGLNHISFFQNGEIMVRPIILHPDRLAEFNSHIMLFYTGIIRTASNIAAGYVCDMEGKKKQLCRMSELLEKSLETLTNGDMIRFGELMHEAWIAKRSLSAQVSNNSVDGIYEAAREAGAIGGKLTGAGGGGFMLLFAPPEKQNKIRETLKNLIHVPFKFDFQGSQIIFNDPEQNYEDLEMDRARREIQPFIELTSMKHDVE